MSYTRSYSRTIRVHYSGSVSYPASQNGGTKSYSGYVDETVNIDVNVDTSPFDSSVDRTKRSADLLTGAVVATETAQVKSIYDNSRKVGNTIISGFFKVVKSELTQQIAELDAQLNATLLHLNQLAARCRSKQEQMGVDYNRLTERYSKIFNELNQELENRIYALDEKVFGLRKTADALGPGTSNGSSVSVTAVSGRESASLQGRILVSLAKRRAGIAIDKAETFLERQLDNDILLSHVLLPSTEGSTYYAPVICMDASTGRGCEERTIEAAPILKGVNDSEIRNRVADLKEAAAIPPRRAGTLRNLFNSLVSAEDSTDSHSKRVRETMVRLFNLDNTATLEN